MHGCCVFWPDDGGRVFDGAWAAGAPLRGTANIFFIAPLSEERLLGMGRSGVRNCGVGVDGETGAGQSGQWRGTVEHAEGGRYVRKIICMTCLLLEIFYIFSKSQPFPHIRSRMAIRSVSLMSGGLDVLNLLEIKHNT
jgi:hypothetical protein